MAEFGALCVRGVLTVLTILTERRDDLDRTGRRGERMGMGGGDGGIGIADWLVLFESMFSTSETVDLFFRIGLRKGGFCKLICEIL